MRDRNLLCAVMLMLLVRVEERERVIAFCNEIFVDPCESRVCVRRSGKRKAVLRDNLLFAFRCVCNEGMGHDFFGIFTEMVL